MTPAAPPSRRDRLDRALHRVMSALPIDLCSFFGVLLSGPMGARRYPARDGHARALISRLRPDLPAAEVDAAVSRLWRSTGRTYAEFAACHRILADGRVAIHGRPHLDAALASGRPLVATFLHTGNWELSFLQLAFLAPGRASLIFDPPAAPERAAIALAVRQEAPWRRLLPKSPTVWRGALETLRQPGGILVTAADEDVAGRIGAPSFGRPLRLGSNLGKAARLAMRTGADILPFYCERLGGARFATHVLPPVEAVGDPARDEDVLSVIRRLDDAFTGPTLRLLDQWYMALTFREPLPDGAHAAVTT